MIFSHECRSLPPPPPTHPKVDNRLDTLGILFANVSPVCLTRNSWSTLTCQMSRQAYADRALLMRVYFDTNTYQMLTEQEAYEVVFTFVSEWTKHTLIKFCSCPVYYLTLAARYRECEGENWTRILQIGVHGWKSVQFLFYCESSSRHPRVGLWLGIGVMGIVEALLFVALLIAFTVHSYGSRKVASVD